LAEGNLTGYENMQKEFEEGCNGYCSNLSGTKPDYCSSGLSVGAIVGIVVGVVAFVAIVVVLIVVFVVKKKKKPVETGG
jgi:hypothetical protein